MLKKIFSIILPLLIILLSLLPQGVIIIFKPSPEKTIKKTYAYFDLLPVGYGNFGPFFTAILSCILLVLCFIYFFRQSKHLSKVIFIISIISLITSMLPLAFMFKSVSIIGIFISMIIVIEIILFKQNLNSFA